MILVTGMSVCSTRIAARRRSLAWSRQTWIAWLRRACCGGTITRAPVCAPARASLLLGQTQGHCEIRDNQFDKALPNNHTVATVLKHAGYHTACIGKWGLQGEAPGYPGHPLRHGFDEFFGFLDHVSGHTPITTMRRSRFAKASTT